jgi:uncharacterized membrane protein YdjX (TVP38/TMEM64 family)
MSEPGENEIIANEEAPEPETERQRLWRRLGPAGVLGVLWAIMPMVLGFTLLAQIGRLSDWLREDPAIGLAAYIAVFAFSAGLGFLPTYAQAILGGWVFGLAVGMPAALSGCGAGALIGYMVARGVSRDRVEKEIEAHPKLLAVRKALIGQGFWKTLGIVTLVRVPPNSPFALTNLVLSSAGTRLAPFLLGTVLGMAPRTGIAAYLAHNAAETGARDLTELTAKSPWMIAATVVAFIVVVAVIGKIAEKALERVTGDGQGTHAAGKAAS